MRPAAVSSSTGHDRSPAETQARARAVSSPGERAHGAAPERSRVRALARPCPASAAKVLAGTPATSASVRQATSVVHDQIGRHRQSRNVVPPTERNPSTPPLKPVLQPGVPPAQDHRDEPRLHQRSNRLAQTPDAERTHQQQRQRRVRGNAELQAGIGPRHGRFCETPGRPAGRPPRLRLRSAHWFNRGCAAGGQVQVDRRVHPQIIGGSSS